MHFIVFAESFTAEVMCRFLDRLADRSAQRQGSREFPGSPN